MTNYLKVSNFFQIGIFCFYYWEYGKIQLIIKFYVKKKEKMYLHIYLPIIW